MDTYILQQGTVSQSTVPLHMGYLPLSLPKMDPWDYLAEELNARFPSERQEPAHGWAFRIMLLFNPFVLVSDPIFMYLLFPEEPGELLLSQACPGWRVK